MFATLLGALPAPPGTADRASRLRAVVRAQEDAGLEPITDGLGATSDPAPEVVERWRATAALTDRAVKAVLRGPWSMARSTRLRAGARTGALGGARAADPAAIASEVAAQVDRLREVVDGLATAGCPLIEIEETEAHTIGSDEASRRIFRDAHERLIRGVEATHLSLSIVGGSAWEAGAATILEPPYRSLAVDLIAGPDNWWLVAATPGDRGIVAGALDLRPGVVEGPEVLLWAGYYAASTGGRGVARVGLGTGGALAHLGWEEALARIRVLGEAIRIASLPIGERASALDPRAVSSRAAALGRARHSEQRGAPGPDPEG